jgi:integrase/recombinase XerD
MATTATAGNVGDQAAAPELLAELLDQVEGDPPGPAASAAAGGPAARMPTAYGDSAYGTGPGAGRLGEAAWTTPFQAAWATCSSALLRASPASGLPISTSGDGRLVMAIQASVAANMARASGRGGGASGASLTVIRSTGVQDNSRYTVLMLEPLKAPTDQAVARTGSADQLVAAWLLGYDSERTRRAYARDLADWLAFCRQYGVQPLGALRAHVDAYARELAEARGQSPATVARRLSALASFYGYAVEEGVIPRSPLAHVRRPKVATDSPSTGFAREELAAILVAAERRTASRQGQRNFALLCLLAYTGCRVGEVLSADVTDLDTERGHRVLRIRRKGGARARVALAPVVSRALDAYLAGRSTGPLFVTSSGRRLDEPAAWRMVRSAARAAELATAGRVNPHSFRHAFVTLARDAGAPLEDVQVAVGHADPRTTRRYDRARYNLDRFPAMRWRPPNGP